MALSLTTGGQGGVFTLRGNTFAGSFNVSTAPIPPTLLLDTYSGSLAAAYSFRKLRNAYTGSAIRVRRSSDNTETNIGFTAAGILDTTALTTFTGAGDGFVTVWYDQSGNGLNVSQATTAAQPKIVAVGTVFTANSKTTMQFDATNDILLRTSSDAEVLAMDSHSSVFVHKVGAIWSNVYAVYQRRISNSNNPINYGPQGDPGSTVRTLYAWNGSAATYSSVAYQLNTQYLENYIGNVVPGVGSMKLFRSNTNVLTSTNSMGTKSIPTNPVFTIGNWTSEFTEKYIQEVIIWSTDQSSNISAINTLVNSYYSIY
tara:strand:- start:146 stop:1087 length:942 start_codon:yes stop_codon:yes gene_type:complete